MTRAIDLEQLDDYLHGGMPDAAAGSFEEELFAAAADGHAEAAEFLDHLDTHVSWLAAEGQFGESYTRAGVDALLARESHVHRIDFLGEGHTDLTPWKPGTKRVVIRLGVDLRGYEHIEITAHKPSAREALITFRDVAFDPTDGNIYAVCMEPVARMALSSGPLHWHVSGSRAGKRETVREYSTHWVESAER